MKPALKRAADAVTEIPVQEASADIWDKKYRLKAKDGTVLDITVDDTWKRVARALADVETLVDPVKAQGVLIGPGH